MNRRHLFFTHVALCGWLTALWESPSYPAQPDPSIRTFQVNGVIQELPANGKTVVVQHQAIPGYMDAMTMPFKVKSPKELAGLRVGEAISFRLVVDSAESWIDQISQTSQAAAIEKQATVPVVPADPPGKPRHPLLDYKFTNELGQAVSLSDFRGQALAITF